MHAPLTPSWGGGSGHLGIITADTYWQYPPNLGCGPTIADGTTVHQYNAENRQ
jgi:hypothetical protein